MTASKRPANVQDVPVAISVLSSEDIDQRGLAGAADYLRGTPGVNQVDSSSNQSIVVRGIETSPQNQAFGTGATTATYFGETPTTNTSGLGAGTSIDIKLVDIERVEVLRGPQGTAFGNSSLGGAVRIIPAAPNPDQLEGRVAAEYSSTADDGGDNGNVQVVGNVPLIANKLAIRGTAYKYEAAGFYQNRAGSDAAYRARVVTPFGVGAFAADDDEVGSTDARGGRLAALLQATDGLSITLSYLSQTTEMDGFGMQTSGSYEQTLLQVAPEHVVRGQRGGVLDTDIDIANAVVEFDLGWGNLLATYSNTESGSRRTQQLNSSNFGFPISSDSRSEHKENVGEIRLVTQLEGSWDFIAGLYTEEVKDDALFDFRWFGTPAQNFFAPGQTFLGDQHHRWKQTQDAAFAEVSWEFLPSFTLTGGARAYDYDRRIETVSQGPFFGGNSSTDTRDDASGSTFRANLSYKPDEDNLIYLSWSQGFRLGKPQSELPAGRCDRNADGIVDGTSISLASTGQFSSDSLDSYELGGKFALLERRVVIDAAVFQMDWTDIPVSVVAGSLAGGCGILYVTNAGEARSKGVELQANVQVAPSLRVYAGGSWINAELTKDAPGVTPPAFEGDRLPGSPEVNANLGVQFEFSVRDHEAFLRADSIYVGTFYGDLAESPNTRSGDYVKLDLSAGVAFDKLTFDVFVRNLTNEDAYAFRDAISRGPLFGYRLQPRTIGLRLGYNF